MAGRASGSTACTKTGLVNAGSRPKPMTVHLS
jgi:hypothetical protein